MIISHDFADGRDVGSKYRCPKDCPDRCPEPNCHTTCELYLKAVEEIKTVNEKIKADARSHKWSIAGENRHEEWLRKGRKR